MEIKITCNCGQKYIFEFDPENGQVPASVNCPACGADGTQEANDILAQIFPEQAARAAAEPVAPPPPVAEKSPLRISISAPSTVDSPPIPPPVTIAPPKSTAPQTKLAWYEHVWTALPLGLVAVGGCIGGGIGGAAWAVNRQVFLKLRQPVLRYVVTGLISVVAVVVWLVVVSTVLGLIRKK